MGFSPDRARLAAIDWDEGVHLVELAGGAIRRIISGRGHDHGTALTAFSRDGARFAAALSRGSRAGDPAAVSIWEAATGRRLAIFPGRSEELRTLTFTPDGRSLLIASQSGVRRWRLPTGDDDRDRQPAGHKDEAWSVAFSPDGRTLATGSDDSEPDPTIKMWETSTGRLAGAWTGGSGTVAALAFSPDGRALASGHLESTRNVRIWDAATRPAAGDPGGAHRPRPRGGLRPRRPVSGICQLRWDRPAVGRRFLA